jgi:hypothetical protein
LIRPEFVAKNHEESALIAGNRLFERRSSFLRNAVRLYETNLSTDGRSVGFHCGPAKKIAQEFQDGVLVGKPGDTFVKTLDQREPPTKKFGGILTDVIHNIEAAIADMKSADNQAGAQS